MLKKILISAAVLALAAYAVFQLFGPSAVRAGAFGNPIDPDTGEVVTVAAIAADPGVYEGRSVIVEAKTGQVCRTSGCWLTLTDGVNNLYVQFYDFTVSVDSSQTVRVQGEIRMQNRSPYLSGRGLEIVR